MNYEPCMMTPFLFQQETVKKSKMIYKDRWAKMVREIQKMKRKNSELDFNEDYLGWVHPLFKSRIFNENDHDNYKNNFITNFRLSDLLESARGEYSNGLIHS